MFDPKTCDHISMKEVQEREKANPLTEVARATSIAFVTMAETGQIDDVTASENAGQFSPWTFPVDYKIGNIRRFGKDLFRCAQNHTSQEDWTPSASATLWTKIGDPAEEWPEWSQPIGAHDAYNSSDKVSHNEKHWTSDVDGNVYEPGVYGWMDVIE